MANNNFFNNIPPVTKHLLLINVLVWGISSLLLHTQGFDLDKYLGLHYVKSPDFNPAPRQGTPRQAFPVTRPESQSSRPSASVATI